MGRTKKGGVEHLRCDVDRFKIQPIQPRKIEFLKFEFRIPQRNQTSKLIQSRFKG